MNRTRKTYPHIAGLILISIFGISATSGLMAQREVVETHKVRQVNPPPKKKNDRKPDSETPAPKEAAPTHADQHGEVVVAVIDTGCDLTHPALVGSAWINPGESGLDANGRDRATNGIDDDGNGFVDDVSGYDFVESRGVVIDDHGHGTHIAGIVLKNAPSVKIMNLKYYNRGIDGATALRNSLRAMRYAIEMKADIINYSGGGTVANSEELQLLSEASRKGILVVAAAGNESTNSERQPFYPANYRLPNILSVTAIDERSDGDELLPTSNFGTRSVAVAAQGKDVSSTLPGGRYGAMTGTSQATAFVTASAVKLIEAGRRDNHDSTPEELIERIVVSSRTSAVLKGKTRLGSKLEASRALSFKNETAQNDRKALLRALRQELSIEASVNPYGL